MRYLLKMTLKDGTECRVEAPTLKTAKRFYRLSLLYFRPYDIRILDTKFGGLYFLCVKKHECRKERKYWKSIEKQSDGGGED